VKRGNLEGGTLRRRLANLVILAGWEKCRNEADFVEVQFYQGVRTNGWRAANGIRVRSEPLAEPWFARRNFFESAVTDAMSFLGIPWALAGAATLFRNFLVRLRQI
jgi:hypothetical protein